MPSRLKRYDEPGHIHFWTISCHRQLDFFHHDDIKQIVIDALAQLKTKFGICLIGYVIMPDHVHVLMYPHAKGSDTPIDISILLRAFKQHVGYHGKSCLREYWRTHNQLWSPSLTNWATNNEHGKPVWKTRGFDFNIHKFSMLIEKLNYCHKNPITRGLVKRAENWPWSSFRYYEFGDRSILPMDWDRAWPIMW